MLLSIGTSLVLDVQSMLHNNFDLKYFVFSQN